MWSRFAVNVLVVVVVIANEPPATAGLDALLVSVTPVISWSIVTV